MKLKSLLSQLLTPWGAAVIFLIFITAFTRLSALGSVPLGLTWDEAALGYVGKMVMTTFRDEHGQLLPRVFTSFGDYKSPLAFYLTGSFTAIFGLHAWVVRLPFALAGIASVILMARAGSLIFKNRWLGLLAGWLLAIAPWHFHFSRVAFESGLALFFFLLTLVAWLEIRDKKVMSSNWLLLAVVGIVGAMYSYHSAKIFLPLALLAMFWHEWKLNRGWLATNRRRLSLTIAATAVGLAPLLISSLLGNGAQRASQTLVFLQEKRLLESVGLFINGIATHLSLQFLVFGQTDTLRHGTGIWGVFSFSQAFLLWLGAAFALSLWFNKNRPTLWLRLPDRLLNIFVRKTSAQGVEATLWLSLALAGLIPAALGFELPHANRALLALPGLILLMVLAVKELKLDLKPLAYASLIGMLILLSSLEFARFLALYHGPYSLRSSSDWLQGYEDAVKIADGYRQQGKTIKFTSAYGQPEIFFGFYLDIPIDEYRSTRVEGVTFGVVQEIDGQNYDIVISSPAEALPQVPAYAINRSDGTTAFFIYEKI